MSCITSAILSMFPEPPLAKSDIAKTRVVETLEASRGTGPSLMTPVRLLSAGATPSLVFNPASSLSSESKIWKVKQ